LTNLLRVQNEQCVECIKVALTYWNTVMR